MRFSVFATSCSALTLCLVCLLSSLIQPALFAQSTTPSAAAAKTAHAAAAAATASAESSSSVQDRIAIGLIVPSIEAARHFYVDLLGFEEAGGFSINEDFGRRSGLSDGVPFKVMLVQPSGGDGSFQIKLVEFATPPSDAPDKVVQAQLGVTYLTLYVDKLDNILAVLAKAGVPTIAETPLKLGDGRGFAIVRDPSGVFVELIERKQ